MSWFKSNLGPLIALACVLAGGMVAWGRMSQICQAVQDKADKSAVVREFDQVHDQLKQINGKLDTLILRPSDNQ